MLHSNTKLGGSNKSKIIPQKQRHKSKHKNPQHTGEINGKIPTQANKQPLPRVQ